ncbi:NAD(P)H-dependent glycerol-3-phosphate dehydrogenase [Clostridium septicum]|uniref:Glycerol-3-phosphate dehydrogenase [NAD(P)+] n=1 Tax=Clostridium septicum TaxID=1504 RepID=A0A9N7JIC7_CLOSE|nr:NAD(P)H-dependent glycerol-3-phosphate dehydrogenase [Clostridium septicum]AYE33134.1 NAD(P)H-dependent glycerol-3-phosphate dehydrogenase [Clostridium septicum]MDU1313457.1 NAD(P)H-dependent glycerol-3-phosphate dehydrogenase [Clostridium septicum]QAS61304.1 NAD(P)H-dependent glycerol-3-phosphate dehydrogenase [Clostridium septicum]UEC19344.1 NAD(P)H-dependent glycerol-3-phosphate dehydrogenase [Clostridium septicum]USR99703.1 NAD(P)H-dependent glycerol-3-phosphate dehydrogenase [Clostridi
MRNVTFLGGGSFGTSLAILLADKGNKIKIYDRDEHVVNDINYNRRNDKYIKNLKIPKNVTAYNDIDLALNEAEFIVLAIPSHVIRSISKELKGKIKENVTIISIAKGIEQGTNLRLSEVIKEELPSNPVVILSGPSHAEEVALNIPTTVVVSSTDMEKAAEVQDIFINSNFRVYTNDDLVGVEIGGAVKNIIALAAGVCDGIGYGDNSKAALMTRGMAEIVRIGMKLGGKPETFLGLTGMGDLIVTCTSLHSRNRRAGYLIGTGKTSNEAIEEVGMIVEGIKACKAFYELKEKLGIEMPITDVAYKVLFKGKDPKEAVKELMGRSKKDEIYY